MWLKRSMPRSMRLGTGMSEVFIHPSAIVESDAIGPGTRIWAFAHVLDGAKIGSECKIGDHAFVEGGATLGDRVTVKNASLIWHGVTIEDDVFVGPRVTFTNDLTPRVEYATGPEDWVSTTVRRGVSIGANSTILCGITLGAYAMVGAGAVVIRDVPSHGLVVGNPARQIGWSCVCGHRIESLRCTICGRSYEETTGGLEVTS